MRDWDMWLGWVPRRKVEQVWWAHSIVSALAVCDTAGAMAIRTCFGDDEDEELGWRRKRKKGDSQREWSWQMNLKTTLKIKCLDYRKVDAYFITEPWSGHDMIRDNMLINWDFLSSLDLIGEAQRFQLELGVRILSGVSDLWGSFSVLFFLGPAFLSLRPWALCHWVVNGLLAPLSNGLRVTSEWSSTCELCLRTSLVSGYLKDGCLREISLCSPLQERVAFLRSRFITGTWFSDHVSGFALATKFMAISSY